MDEWPETEGTRVPGNGGNVGGYVLRSRFIFATAHLSHQLNLLRQEGWGEERLPPDGGIWFDAMDVQGQP